MSHNRQSSMSSLASTLSNEFKDKVEDNIRGPDPTEYHVEGAKEQIRWLKSRNDDQKMIKYLRKHINAASILEAMLQFSDMAGGVDGGQRYTACAINTCDYAVHEHKLLTNLAETWLTYFLYPFRKASRTFSENPTENATPDLQDTASRLEPARDSRNDLTHKLLQRDGNKCVITGLPHWERVTDDYSGMTTYTEGAHFIRRSLGTFSENDRATSGITWSIIRNYTHMSTETIDEMSQWIDEPANGMTLDTVVHRAFDQLRWCLVPQSEDNTYKIKVLKGWTGNPPKSDTVVFRDHSGLPYGIPLPNRQFVALHAAVAHVLHMSGAAEVIDEVLDHFGDSGAVVPAQSSSSARDLPARIAAIRLLEGMA